MSKNLKRVQDMLDGNYNNKIVVGNHSIKSDQTREVGEEWVDSDGTPWKQMEGYRAKGRIAVSGQRHYTWDHQCKDCNTYCFNGNNKKAYKAHGRCYYCQIDFEAELKLYPIRYWAWMRLQDLNRMDSIEKDMEQWVEEITEQRKQNPYDMKVANALANGEVEMSIKKTT